MVLSMIFGMQVIYDLAEWKCSMKKPYIAVRDAFDLEMLTPLSRHSRARLHYT